MINKERNIKLAQIIADRHSKPVAIWSNANGQVNIQLADEKPISPYTNLAKVVNPS